MAIHENPPTMAGNLASQTEGTKVEPPGIFCGHTLGLSVSTATGLATQAAAAAALGATQAIVYATGAARFTLDGTTTPTATVGIPIPAGGSVVLNMADATVAKFFGTTIDVWFTM